MSDMQALMGQAGVRMNRTTGVIASAFLIAACAHTTPTPTPTLSMTEIYIAVAQTLEAEATGTAPGNQTKEAEEVEPSPTNMATETATRRPTNTPPPPTWTSTPTPRPPSPTRSKATYPVCSAATPGTFVTCQIDRTYCDYRPDVNGQPTFCNDAPFPGHSFTLLVWGQDWSNFDGRCLLVTGQITRFRGKPQIEATRRSQVEFCC